MANTNEDNLERTLSNNPQGNPQGNPQPGQQGPPQGPQPGQQGQGEGQPTSQEEEIGHHKGALNTLVNERNELLKMAQNVESVMQAHIQRLQQLGVNIQQQGQGQQGQGQQGNPQQGQGQQ